MDVAVGCAKKKVEMPLFDRLKARKDDPPTSKEAAHETVKGLKGLQLQVYNALVNHDRDIGLTFKELSEKSGINRDTCWKRLGELGRKNKARVICIRDNCRAWRAIRSTKDGEEENQKTEKD